MKTCDFYLLFFSIKNNFKQKGSNTHPKEETMAKQTKVNMSKYWQNQESKQECLSWAGKKTEVLSESTIFSMYF